MSVGVSPEIEAILSEIYGPVEAMFTITQVPAGSAPLEIRERWLDVPLPVRHENLGAVALSPEAYTDELSGESRVNEEPVSVAGQDAVHALYVAERWDASDFWVPYQMGLFKFRASEGILTRLET